MSSVIAKPLFIPPFATPAHAYLIVAGILLGVLAGPGVMKRLAPDWHRAFFHSVDLTQLENDHRDELDRFYDQITGTGVSKEYVDEQVAQIDMVYQAKLNAGRQAERHRVATLVLSLTFAIFLVMILEAVLSPDPRAGCKDNATPTEASPVVGRLITIRYALAGLAVALLLASPGMLMSLPFGFLALLLAIALILGLIPLGRKAHP